MAWVLLFFAGLFEIGWAIGLKYTYGWSRLTPSVLTLVAMIVSFYLLSLALKELPIGTAYAVWTGIGAAGTAIIGILWFGEALNAIRVASLAAIVLGVIGLKFASNG